MTTDDREALRARFSDAGLPFPDLPPAGDDARLVSDWHLTTRPEGPSPYRVGDHVREFESGPVDDYVVLAHAGHGVNSWAISYLVVDGSVGVFVQTAWGGAAASSDEDQVRLLEERFDAVDRLLSCSRDAMPAGSRLVVVDSDLGDHGWAVLPPDGPAERKTSSTPLVDALAYLRA